MSTVDDLIEEYEERIAIMGDGDTGPKVRRDAWNRMIEKYGVERCNEMKWKIRGAGC